MFNAAAKKNSEADAECIAGIPLEDDGFDPTRTIDSSSQRRASEESETKYRNYITHLIFEMEDSLIQLGAKDVTTAKLEEMAVFIYESMSISTRNYHSVQHVFDIINHDRRLKQNPIAVLSACFHDCIYYHVDGGLTPLQAELLKGSFVIDGPGIENEHESDFVFRQRYYKFFATETRNGSDEGEMALLKLVETIFGYTPGQNIRITNDGLNEFLSAVVAVRMLQNHLPIEMLAQIACNIEATIPFRQHDKITGKTHMAHLYENMEKARDRFNLQLSENDLVNSVQQACLLSNSDVGNFGTTDRHFFLDNTWSLLPETNESLRNEYVYTVDHFHKALFNMHSFFGFLQPAVVFHEYQGIPAAEEMDRLTQECTNNLEFGRTYVGAKLVAMSLVSAFVVLSGGDAPIALFTGDLRASERRSQQLNETRFHLASQTQRTSLASQKTRPSDFLHASLASIHDLPLEHPESYNELVYEILAEGRRSKSSFDTKRSPWAALLYKYLGDEGLNRVLTEHTLYPMTPDRAWGLLRALPADPVHFIATSMADQALSRADKMMDVLSQLNSTGAE